MVICGPIYGWAVLAKTAIKLTPKPEDALYLSYVGKGSNLNQKEDYTNNNPESKGWIKRLISKFNLKGLS